MQLNHYINKKWRGTILNYRNSSSLHRYELKFKINSYSKAIFKKRIKLISANFNKAFPSRFINNIYLDSYNYINCIDNINGEQMRKKTRIRWYGNLFGKVSPSLEIKERNGSLVKKTVNDFPSFCLNKNQSINEVHEIYKSYTKNFFLTPSIINRYRREYFISKDKRFRITLDDNQIISNPKNTNFIKNLNPIDEKVIVEIKFSPEFFKYLNELTNDLNLRLAKNSKYLNSVLALAQYGYTSAPPS